jgi:hypothetical protein
MSRQTNISLAVAAIVGISSVALILQDAMAARSRAAITRLLSSWRARTS